MGTEIQWQVCKLTAPGCLQNQFISSSAKFILSEDSFQSLAGNTKSLQNKGKWNVINRALHPLVFNGVSHPTETPFHKGSCCVHQRDHTAGNLPHQNKRQVASQHLRGRYTMNSQDWATPLRRVAGWPCCVFLALWANCMESLVNVPTTAELLSLTGMLKIKPPDDAFSLCKYHAW